MNTYCIADLHGRYDLLEATLNKLLNYPKGRFVCLGDFIDRGPDSRKIIERFIVEQQSDAWDEFIVLQGNHEDIMLQACNNPNLIRWWRSNGGNQTLKSYGIKPCNNPIWTTNAIPIEHLRWLANLPYKVEDAHRIFVHAGLPMDAMEATKETMQWMMYRQLNGHHFPDAEYHEDSPSHISGKHIVHGHEQSKDHPLLLEGRTNLDTFAWATGRLAIGIFDSEIPGGPVEVIEVYGEPDLKYRSIT